MRRGLLECQALGVVEKAILWRSFYVGTGLVLQDESFRMNPCPNSKEDSHKGCPYDLNGVSSHAKA